MKIDWKRKLTSRKFWAAIVGFVTPLIITLGGTTTQATQIAGLIMSGGTLIAYIIGEGLADSGETYINYGDDDLYVDDIDPQTDEDDDFEDAEGLEIVGK